VEASMAKPSKIEHSWSRRSSVHASRVGWREQAGRGIIFLVTPSASRGGVRVRIDRSRQIWLSSLFLKRDRASATTLSAPGSQKTRRSIPLLIEASVVDRRMLLLGEIETCQRNCGCR
jgi:hypothetical protein